MTPNAPTAQDTGLTYLPIDRRQALARGETLPERTEGAGLFADISGFTALTDALLATTYCSIVAGSRTAFRCRRVRPEE